MSVTSEDRDELIEPLREALVAERRALLSGSAEAIMAAASHKTSVAERIERATRAGIRVPPDPEGLQSLARYNQENAIICDTMLRHLTAAIDRLRRHDPHRSYGPDGSEHSAPAQHALGSA